MKFKKARFRNNIVLGMIVFIICLMLMPQQSLAASKLKKPVISSAKASGRNIVIKWSKVSGAKKYQVYIKKNNKSYKLVATTKSVKYTYKDSYYNNTYTVKVRAINGKKKSTFSKVKTVALVKVPEKARIQYVKETTSKLKLKWYTSTGANKYQVRIKQEGSSWKIVKTLSSTKKTYTYTKPDKTAVYYIQVRGVNKTSLGTAYGKYSAVYSTGKIQPVVTTDANKVTITWNKITGCNKYRVEYGRFQLKGMEYTKTTKKNTISFTGKYCTEYKVRVFGISGTTETYSDYIYFDTGSNPNLIYKRILSLPSYEFNSTYIANRTDGICFVENDLYYIKSAKEGSDGTHDGYYPMILGCITDFDTYTDTQNPPATIKEIRYSNGTLYYANHGSSITYVAPYFYIVTLGSYKNKTAYTAKVSKDGVVLDEISGTDFSALSYFGTNTSGNLQFLSRAGKRYSSSGEQHKFITKILSDSAFTNGTVYLTEEVFTMTDPDGSVPHCNDIYYDLDNKLFYQTVFVYDDSDDQDISKNWIYCFDMSDQDSMEVDNSMYIIPTKSVTKCNLSTTNSSETEFEVEGIAVYDDKVYLGVNTEGVEDALYMIK